MRLLVMRIGQGGRILQAELAHMVMSRTANSREHSCVRCDRNFSSTALFREHVLNGDCDLDRGSMLVYLQRIGVRHYACTGCQVWWH